MHRLAEFTGQHDAIARIIQCIRLPRKECIIVSGPPGSGVSWTLSQAGVSWEHQTDGVALKATGMAMTPLRPLLPWLTMSSPDQHLMNQEEQDHGNWPAQPWPHHGPTLYTLSSF